MNTVLRKLFFLLTVSGLMLMSLWVNAREEGVESLSPEIRVLLQKEMRAIEGGMKVIVSANAAGDTEQIARIARQIQDGFILKQHLTKYQKHELHSKLPPGFLKRDKEFHYMAGMLAHVAEKNKSELVGFYYSKLFEACVSCHSVYATHRFSRFEASGSAESHSH